MAAVFAGAASHARADSDLAYFKQFIYKKESSDDGDGEVHVQFRMLLADQELLVNSNQIVVAHFELFLNEDMSATFRYSEMYKVRADEHAEWKFEVREFCPYILNGNYSVPNQQLLLNDLTINTRDT